MQVWHLLLPITIFLFMVFVVVALRPSVTIFDFVVWTRWKTCSKWKPTLQSSSQRVRGPGKRGCHHPVLRGHAGHLNASPWCSVKCALVWFTRKCMEYGGCSREAFGLRRQSGGFWRDYVLKCHSFILAKQTSKAGLALHTCRVQVTFHL